jgi:hypothetical protein
MERTGGRRTTREVPAEEALHMPPRPPPDDSSMICFLRERDMFALVEQASDTFRRAQESEFKEEVKHKLNRQTRALETSYEPSGKEQRSLDARLLARSLGVEASFVQSVCRKPYFWRVVCCRGDLLWSMFVVKDWIDCMNIADDEKTH